MLQFQKQLVIVLLSIVELHSSPLTSRVKYVDSQRGLNFLLCTEIKGLKNFYPYMYHL